MSKVSNVSLGFMLIWILMSFASAQSAGTPALPKINPTVQQKQVVEEIVHQFRVQKFEQPLMFSGVVSKSNLEPEFVWIQYINALKLGRLDDAVALWDEESKRKIEQDMQQRGMTKSGLAEKWRSLYENKEFFVRERIVYGSRYVLLPYYEAVAGSTPLLRETLAFVKVRDGWRLTLDLAENPVKIGWMSSGERIRRLANPDREK